MPVNKVKYRIDNLKIRLFQKAPTNSIEKWRVADLGRPFRGSSLTK